MKILIDTTTIAIGWSFNLIKVAVLVCLCILALFMAFRIGVRVSTPYPVRAFADARGEFAGFAREIGEGNVKARKDSQGYVLNNSLIGKNVRYVRTRNNCIEFFFESLPPDPIEKLIYSPEGYPGLPNYKVNDNGRGLCFFLIIDDNWYYARED